MLVSSGLDILSIAFTYLNHMTSMMQHCCHHCRRSRPRLRSDSLIYSHLAPPFTSRSNWPLVECILFPNRETETLPLAESVRGCIIQHRDSTNCENCSTFSDTLQSQSRPQSLDFRVLPYVRLYPLCGIDVAAKTGFLRSRYCYLFLEALYRVHWFCAQLISLMWRICRTIVLVFIFFWDSTVPYGTVLWDYDRMPDEILLAVSNFWMLCNAISNWYCDYRCFTGTNRAPIKTDDGQIEKTNFGA